MDPIKSKRVPRFVEEYVIDRNGTQAAMRAGYTQNANAASVTAARLLGDARVQELIREQMDRVSKEATVQAADILRQWLEIATADPVKVVRLRRVNCRHCWGEAHEYQWSAREYAKACDAAANARNGQGVPAPQPMPDCSGGFGWVHNADPNPECPECRGEGVAEPFVADMETLSGPERRLVAGMKVTRDGIEVKMRDQDLARDNLAKWLGMLVEKRELTGKNGAPLVPAIPAELPKDPAQLAALYRTALGG